MDKKLKAKWLRALKSGRYGKGEIRMCVKRGTPDDYNITKPYDRFCCLGVLCEIAKQPYTASTTIDTEAIETVSNDVAKHIGFLYRLNDGIIDMNDDGTLTENVWPPTPPKDFAPVIKYIEKNL